MRVMSFNIRHGRAPDGAHRWYKRRDLVFDTIRSHAPQIVALQEANPVQLDETLAALPTFGVIADRAYGGRMGSYAAILFDRDTVEAEQSGDFWLAPDPDGKRVRAWDADVARICTWAVFQRGDDRFCVFNTHFDQRGQTARVESARIVVDRLARFVEMPRLFCGDLNAKPDNEAIGILLASGLRDTYVEIHPGENQKTFHGFRDVKSIGRVDYILCDEKWTVDDAQVVLDGADGRFASDHFAITADVGFRRKNPQ